MSTAFNDVVEGAESLKEPSMVDVNCNVEKIYVGNGGQASGWVPLKVGVIENRIVPRIEAHTVSEDYPDEKSVYVNSTKHVSLNGWTKVKKELFDRKLNAIIENRRLDDPSDDEDDKTDELDCETAGKLYYKYGKSTKQIADEYGVLNANAVSGMLGHYKMNNNVEGYFGTYDIPEDQFDRIHKDIFNYYVDNPNAYYSDILPDLDTSPNTVSEMKHKTRCYMDIKELPFDAKSEINLDKVSEEDEKHYHQRVTEDVEPDTDQQLLYDVEVVTDNVNNTEKQTTTDNDEQSSDSSTKVVTPSTDVSDEYLVSKEDSEQQTRGFFDRVRAVAVALF